MTTRFEKPVAESQLIRAGRRRVDALLFILNGCLEALKRDEVWLARTKARSKRLRKVIQRETAKALNRYAEIDGLKVDLQATSDPHEQTCSN